MQAPAPKSTKTFFKSSNFAAAKFGTFSAMPRHHFTPLLILAAFCCAMAAGLEEFDEFGGGPNDRMGSIATGSGRIFRPARSVEETQAEMPLDSQPIEFSARPMMKRSMSLGRLQFRPGKRRFLPMAGAFAHDPLNRRYELLFLDDHSEGANVPEEGLKGGQPKLISHLRFRLLPGMIDSDGEDIPSGIAEAEMGKRSSLASGRIGFRPAKRSMAVGRTGFRPGKRSIATGRVHFRPGKRSLAQYPAEDDELFLI